MKKYLFSIGFAIIAIVAICFYEPKLEVGAYVDTLTCPSDTHKIISSCHIPHTYFCRQHVFHDVYFPHAVVGEKDQKVEYISYSKTSENHPKQYAIDKKKVETDLTKRYGKPYIINKYVKVWKDGNIKYVVSDLPSLDGKMQILEVCISKVENPKVGMMDTLRSFKHKVIYVISSIKICVELIDLLFPIFMGCIPN